MSAVSSTISSVVSSAAASATASSCASADFTKFPTSDIACAVGSTAAALASNTSSVFKECCKSAPVESFNGDCGFYCLSVEQSVSDLQTCFMENGISPETIFCNGNNTASATGTPSGGASPTASRSAGTSGTGMSASGSAGAANGVVPQVSKAGLGIVAIIIVSVFAGATL
ncbi:uncharacterized protein M421DRAFT_418129 [Didymella exigua CBS 183.55]|uniref:Uncharacterized protein n=1 Tax=Didymella exigua CBS 183.55 TaxID=1150837 RepID=A0A6A5RQN6_9PLEO|nr:uncharacterized protein M421DRAFT_418129 [Didymella exigua CBS 183.55]KAF1930655.1 hypothetical protein M421DRAFT_418129 [Didymella exigua CBS 183.55]